MTDLDILKLEGVVVRLIPSKSISLLSYKEGDEERLRDGQDVVVRNGRRFVRETRSNSLGGKYLLTFRNDQCATVIFANKYDGIGDSIEEAYADYLKKNT